MDLRLAAPQASPAAELTNLSGPLPRVSSRAAARTNSESKAVSVALKAWTPEQGIRKGTNVHCHAIGVVNSPEVIRRSIPPLESLKAIIFDVDGTLCDSDPLHHIAFVELLQQVGFQGGKPITEEFFVQHITGRDVVEVVNNLFPDWEEDKRMDFMEEKEARFRSLALAQLKPVEGLETLCQWIKNKGLKRAAVTNAPRANAELMLSILGLSDFFEILVVGTECERAKPFPDPYLKALNHLGLSADEAFVFEDSSTGLQAAISAGMAAVGIATRNSEESLSKAGASLVVSSFKDPKLWDSLQG